MKKVMRRWCWLMVAVAVILMASVSGQRVQASDAAGEAGVAVAQASDVAGEAEAVVAQAEVDSAGVYIDCGNVVSLPVGFMGITERAHVAVRTINNDIVYCIELGTGIHGSGDDYPLSSSQELDNLTDYQKQMLGYALLYGYTATDVTTDQAAWHSTYCKEQGYYAATQIVVWEILRGYTSAAQRAEVKEILLDTGQTVWLNGFNDETYIEEARTAFSSYYDSLWASIDSAVRIPSFSAMSSDGCPVYTLKYNVSMGLYSVTLTDENGVIGDVYTTYGELPQGMTYSISGNEITFTCTDPIAGELLVQAVPAAGSAQAAQQRATLYRWVWDDNDWQELIQAGTAESKQLYGYLQLETELPGYIDVQKVGENTGKPVGNAVYTIYTDIACTGAVGTMTTDANGYAKSGPLPQGLYYVKETEAPVGYAVNDSIESVQVVSEQTGRLALINEEPEWTANITLTKMDSLSGVVLPGAVFAVYEWSAGEDTYIFMKNLDELGSGVYASGGLYYTNDNQGRFKVEEISRPAGYAGGYEQEFEMDISLPGGELQTFAFNETVENTPTRYRFIKTDEAGEGLAGCDFQLYDSNGGLVDSWTTDETGIYEITARLLVGETYTLKEIKSPIGYEPAADTVFMVGSEASWVEVEVLNRKIPGSVTVIKRGIDGELLEGAEYALLSTEEVSGADTYEYGGGVYYVIKTAAAVGGTAVFDGLDTGEDCRYLLVEVKAPEGTSLLKEPIDIGTLSGPTYDLTYTITNTAGFVIPHTGEINHFSEIFMLMFAAVAFAGCAIHHKSSSMKNKEEKR